MMGQIPTSMNFDYDTHAYRMELHILQEAEAHLTDSA